MMEELLFVGREQELDAYQQFLARETPWVLIITGLGGIGKTTLLRRLADYTLGTALLTKTGVVMIDFANEDLHNDPLKLLDTLTQDLLPYSNLQQVDIELKKALQQNVDQLTQIRKERIRTGLSETEDPVLLEIRHQMRELATEALYVQIKALAVSHLVIMLDTCEWLIEPEGVEVGLWILNELVPGIHTRMKQQKQLCSVVMVSRVQLYLEAINGREQLSLALPMLDRAAVDQYLQHVGMQDYNLRQQVYNVTHGHALVVSIIGDFWKHREEQTQTLTIADLPELEIYSDKALMQFTNERVLRQLRSPYLELTRFGILLRSFNLPLLRIVFPELLPEDEALERFNELIRHPFIESRGNYRYAFHELLREALAEGTQKEAPEQWKQYHKRALDYFTEISPQSSDWYYHLLAYDEKRGLAAWKEAIREARSIGMRERTGALLQATIDAALKLSPGVRAEIAYELYLSGQWDGALKSYNEALNSFQQADDFSGQAKTLQAIGDVQRALDNHDDALANYDKALLLYQQLEELEGQARCYQAMGDVQRLRYELGAELQYYTLSLNLFRQLKDRSGEAKALESIGEIQLLRSNLDAAFRSYEEALALYQGEQDARKRARVLKAIGDVHCQRKDTDAALESYGQALAIFVELKEPVEEANVRRAIDEIEKPQSEQAPLSLIGGKSGGHSELVVQPRPSFQSNFSRFGAVIIGLIALIAVGGSLFYYTSVLPPARLSAQATAQAQATTQAHVHATENAIATVVAQTTALATALTSAPHPFGGKLILIDPLQNNTAGRWEADDSNTSGDGCRFIQAAYHINATNFFHLCPEHGDDFSNVVFQVTVVLNQGSSGGMIFRATNGNSAGYYFTIGWSGHFEFTILNGQTPPIRDDVGITSASSQRTYVLDIVANNSSLGIYVNNEKVYSINDSTYSHGTFALFVDGSQEDRTPITEATFSNLLVWQL